MPVEKLMREALTLYVRRPVGCSLFLLINNWIKVGKSWKIASEIILPVPPSPAVKD
jgi:hypothetical protein